MKKSYIFITLIIIIVIILLLLFTKRTVRGEVTFLYGPYSCGTDTLSIVQKARINYLAGLIINDDVEFSFKSNKFRILKYPVHSQTVGSLTEKTPFTASEIKEYLDTNTTGSTRLTKEDNTESEQLISAGAVNQNDLVAFSMCYSEHIGDIITDKAKKEVSYIGSEAGQSRFNFDTVYARKLQ